MADRKISELTQITGANVDDANDEIAIVDTSASETKAITRAELMSSVSSMSITGDLTVDTNTLYVDSANNRVGIGTSSPAFPLDVAGGDVQFEGVPGNAGFFFDASRESVALGTSSLDNALDTTAPGIQIQQRTNNAYAILQTNPDGSFICKADPTSLASGSYVRFDVDGSEAMRIDSSGNVGIGTSSPNAKLSTFVSSNYSVTYNDLSGSGLHIPCGGTEGSGNYGGAITFGNLSGATDRQGAAISSVQTTSDPDQLGLAFFTHPSSFTTPDLEEAMRIDSSGNLLVGTTTLPNGSSDGMAIRSDGTITTSRGATSTINHMFFRNPNGLVGTIQTSGSSTSYNTSSDERLKENIADAQPASDLIDGIQVREFDWKVDGEHQRYGMVAQELETVAPEAVTKGETEDDMWSVDYSKLVPMLVKEIQDLRKRVNELEATA